MPVSTGTMSDETIDRVLDVNLRGTILTVQAFLPLLLAFVYGWVAERSADRAWAATAKAS